MQVLCAARKQNAAPVKTPFKSTAGVPKAKAARFLLLSEENDVRNAAMGAQLTGDTDTSGHYATNSALFARINTNTDDLHLLDLKTLPFLPITVVGTLSNEPLGEDSYWCGASRSIC